MKKLISLMLLVSMLMLGVYADSAPSYWAQDEYDAAKALALVIPEVDNDFQNSITRKEFCKLIVNMVQVQKRELVEITIENPFLDIDEDDVTKAYQLGIVKGVSDTKFAPDRLISRQEIAVMMMRAARKLDEMNGTFYTSNIDVAGISFADETEIAGWAIDHVKDLNKLGLMKGVGKNKIGPLRPTKREEGILLTYRLYKGYTEAVAAANVAPEAVANPVELTVKETVELVIGTSDLATDANGDALEIKKVGDTDLEAGTPVALDHGKIVLEDGSLKYTSNDLDKTKEENFVVTLSDSAETVDVNVKITVENVLVLEAKQNLEFETPEDTALEITIDKLALGYSDEAKISLFDHKPDQDVLGSTGTSNDRRSAIFTPTKDITKNETEVLAMKVTDGDQVVEMDVSIKVTEVGNVSPLQIFGSDFFEIYLDGNTEQKIVDITDMVIDPDNNDDDTTNNDTLEVVSIDYWREPGGSGFVMVPANYVSLVKDVYVFSNPLNQLILLTRLKAGPAVINIPAIIGNANSLSTDYRVVVSDGTDEIAIKVRATKILP